METNIRFSLATRLINHTARHLFLTGRAGTGKTTFLRHIRKTSPKKMVVVAPTGVAAINAGGVTMHSFFQLPFGTYMPDASMGWSGGQNADRGPYDRNALFRNIRFNKEKIALLRELELLVIDEVSMLRADALDAIDTVLRNYRRSREPFGGLQVLYIGDLYQLPPVVTRDEERIMGEAYESAFFFSSRALAEAPPLVLELDTVYRQQGDDGFISILNSIRHANIDHDELEALHRRYLPQTSAEKGVITLCTHNAQADRINNDHLNALLTPTKTFEAEHKGEFNAQPAERSLQLKVGAQIMFLVNDKGESRKFFNGKLAQIYHIGDEGDIWVRLEGSGEEMKVEKHTWRSIRYRYNEETDGVEEDELGSFTQYPIRLAWAITIHKSQGLTFERAVVDVGSAFAPGQVYVALSRLTSLGGLVLHSKLPPGGIPVPEVVVNFCNKNVRDGELEILVQREESLQAEDKLRTWLSAEKWRVALDVHHREYEHRAIGSREEAIAWSDGLRSAADIIRVTFEKFRPQLDALLRGAKTAGDYDALHARVQAAVAWMDARLVEAHDSVGKHYAEYLPKPKTKQYLGDLRSLEAALLTARRHLYSAVLLTSGLAGVAAPTQPSIPQAPTLTDMPPRGAAVIKGETFATSLRMFREGKTIPEIAAARNLSAGTIESHLARYITSGDLPVTAVVSAEKLALIKVALEKCPPDSTMTAVKELLPAEMSFNEIRTAMGWLRREN